MQNQPEELLSGEEQEGDEQQNTSENALMYIYEWVDSIPLSRQKKNIARDFNDAVLLAEMIKHTHPRLVDLHNYPSACSTKQKLSNWETLNKKVLRKLGLKISKEEILDVMNSKPNAIEELLTKVYHVIHGIPLESKKQMKQVSDVIQEEDNRQVNQREIPGEEEAQLLELIMQKDQILRELKDHIENLEKQLKLSKTNQDYLERRLAQLNEIIRKNEIEF